MEELQFLSNIKEAVEIDLFLMNEPEVHLEMACKPVFIVPRRDRGVPNGRPTILTA